MWSIITWAYCRGVSSRLFLIVTDAPFSSSKITSFTRLNLKKKRDRPKQDCPKLVVANGDLKISLLRCTNKRRLHLTPKKLLPCTLKTCLLPAGFAVKSSSTGWPIRRWKERRWAPLARTKALKDRTSRGFGGGGGVKIGLSNTPLSEILWPEMVNRLPFQCIKIINQSINK